jgi:hypothetical protein
MSVFIIHLLAATNWHGFVDRMSWGLAPQYYGEVNGLKLLPLIGCKKDLLFRAWQCEEEGFYTLKC